MPLSIFLLLYLKEQLSLVSTCLSNPRKMCSVASYQYNSNCRVQFDSRRTNIYETGQYHGFLGEGVQARAYSEHGGSSDFARSNAELQCHSVVNCSWRNVEDDQLDWIVGEGNVNSAKLSFITGSQTVPGGHDHTFLILASDPRPSFHGGMLASIAIGCQQSAGILTFRYWRSRARTLGYEPDLDICTRKALDTTFMSCLTVTPTENHTIIASIPPILEPFEIVIRGYGFENEPEGGVILLDQIDYFAHIDQPENCVAKPINRTEIEPFGSGGSNKTKKKVISGDNSQHNTLLKNLDLQRAVKGNLNHDETDIIVINENNDVKQCRSLSCFLDGIDSTCDFKRVGESASGEGFYVGWRVTSLKINRANKLTGINLSPNEDDDALFLIAEFPGFQRKRITERFVLESQEYLMNSDSEAFLAFNKYLATQSIELNICEDPQGLKCFWDVYENSKEPFIRRWTREVVQIPKNLTRFFIISAQDSSVPANVGQIGLSNIGLFSDSQATLPFC